jgi:Sulfotransferase family
MAVICRKYNLLFIMTPRTACTAIGELLCQDYDGEFLPAVDILDADGRISVQKKHSTLAELLKHKILAPEEAKSLLKIAAVRNPFDTLVSLYFKQRFKYQPLLTDPNSWVNRSPTYARNMRYAREHSFTRWVFRKCSRQFAKRLLGCPPSMFVDYTNGTDLVMRYESIEQDLQGVLRRSGMEPKAGIPVVNRTDERTDRNYRSHYSRAAALAVSVAFRDDLKTYGYKF